MNKVENIKNNPKKRPEYKEIKRKIDLSDLINKKITGNALQKRNSMFTDIDWSEITIFESNGYSWQPNNKTIKTKV